MIMTPQAYRLWAFQAGRSYLVVGWTQVPDSTSPSGETALVPVVVDQKSLGRPRVLLGRVSYHEPLSGCSCG